MPYRRFASPPIGGLILPLLLHVFAFHSSRPLWGVFHRAISLLNQFSYTACGWPHCSGGGINTFAAAWLMGI